MVTRRYVLYFFFFGMYTLFYAYEHSQRPVWSQTSWHAINKTFRRGTKASLIKVRTIT